MRGEIQINLWVGLIEHIEALLHDTELRQDLILGAKQLETVPLFSEALRGKMTALMGFLQKTRGGYIPNTDEAIELIKRGDGLINELEIYVQETEEDKALFSKEKARLTGHIDNAISLISYIVKHEVLSPILMDDDKERLNWEKYQK